MTDKDNEGLFLFQYPLRPANRPYGDHGDLSKVEFSFGNQDSDPSNQQMSEDPDHKSASAIQSFKMTYDLKGTQEDEDFKNYDPDTKDNRVS